MRLRVTKERIQVWLDGEQLVDQSIVGRKRSTRIEVDLSRPLGLAVYQTRAAMWEIRLRRLVRG